MKIRKKLKKWLFGPPELHVSWDQVPLLDDSNLKIEAIQASHRVLKVTKDHKVIGYFRSMSDLKAIQASFAVEKLAGILGLADMVPHTEYAKLLVDGEELRGTLQEPAKGECIIEIDTPERRAAITPSFQRAINRMNIMDVISHDADHSPNNYNVIFDSQRKAAGISCFDNNGVGSFPLSASICFETYKQCSAIVTADGSFNRPYVDGALKNTLQHIRLHDLLSLKEHLRSLRILFVWFRIKRLVKVLSGLSSDRILSEPDWSPSTIEKELSGQYGKTYLTGYLVDCCVPAKDD